MKDKRGTYIGTLTGLLDNYQRELKQPLRPIERTKIEQTVEALIYALRVLNREKQENQTDLF